VLILKTKKRKRRKRKCTSEPSGVNRPGDLPTDLTAANTTQNEPRLHTHLASIQTDRRFQLTSEIVPSHSLAWWLKQPDS